ncbi:MAG: leucine-rich repeat protein [Oscillospiraceae bacterium]|nr:leucine-rich repeat protein [Oscillospiraceae bacterium]
MKAKKLVSIILSALMVCSMFSGLTAFADETKDNEISNGLIESGAAASIYSVATADEATEDEPTVPDDEDEKYSGTTGDCLWNFDGETATLTISGDGEMEPYYSVESTPWYDFLYNIEKIVIEDGVANIASCAFFDCANLTEVSIPESVLGIGDFAFASCASLTELTIVEGVTSIGNNAFAGCICLPEVTLPDSLTEIGDEVFSGCTELCEVTFGNGLEYIGIKDFYGCENLTTVTLGESLTLIGKSAFEDCACLTGIALPDGVESIEMNAFCGCTELAEASLGSGISIIGEGAFADCGNLIDIYYNGSLYDWESVYIDSGNDYILDACMYYAVLVEQEIYVPEEEYSVSFGTRPFDLEAEAETDMTFVSSNRNVASVSEDGIVTVKGLGTAIITITAEEDEVYLPAKATVKIIVTKAKQKISGVKEKYVTSAGKTVNLKARANTGLTFTSSNKSVATVSKVGKVTVKGAGSAVITIKAVESNKYKSTVIKTKIIASPKNFNSKDVSKVSKTGTTKAKLTWKKLAGANGYTVQYATNKNFKNAKYVKVSKTTATISGLKQGKTYYARINAFVKVSGKKYFNKWYTVKIKM